MFGQKSGNQISGLSRRLGETSELLVDNSSKENQHDRKELFNKVRPLAQKRLQQKIKSEELADRHSPALRQRVRKEILEIIETESPGLPKPVQVGISDELVDDLLGYGPLERYFTGPLSKNVTEIKVINPQTIRVEIAGKEILAMDENGDLVSFRDEQHCRDVLDRMLAPTGRRVDLSTPRVMARLPDGSRLMAHIPPVAVDGTTFAIRRFMKGMTLENLMERGALNEEMAELITACVKARLNIIVSGGTSSGKSTVLNSLAAFIPEDESIITIEDPAELQLMHTNVRRLEAKPKNIEGEGEVTQRDLMADALRMAPKRIIVGEVRRGEAFDMMQAMNTGHDGSITTGHANSAYEMVNQRLVNMIQMADMGLPYESILGQISSGLDIVIHATKDRTGKRRLDHLCEVGKITKGDTLHVELNPVYTYDMDKGTWIRTVNPFTQKQKLEWAGIKVPAGVS